MPILVYRGLGTRNMLTAGRNQGSITTGIDRFLLTYSHCHRTVPRVSRERKRKIKILIVDSPIAMRYASFFSFFSSIFLILETGFGQDAPGVQKSQFLVA